MFLGEINDAQRVAWCRCLEVFDEDRAAAAQMALSPQDRLAPQLACEVVQVRLDALDLRHPRQRGACWLACTLECDPPDSGKRRFGDSRDKRFECVQVVIVLTFMARCYPSR